MNSFLRLFAVLLSISSFGVYAQVDIYGAGSSLAFPVIQELVRQFKEQKKIEITYHSTGSGEGIRRIVARAVDFALSDIPLTQYELNTQDLVQFPVFASAIVPVVNLPGLENQHLTLTGSILADMYLGRIIQWNDKAIQELNPSLNLPQLPIKVIYRSDVSGSSYVFTSYLSKASVHWNDQYGIGSKVRWPVGEGAKGSNGVQEAVKNTKGAIGYLEYGVASSAQFSLADLVIGEKVVIASPETFSKAFDILSPVRSSFYQFTTPSLSQPRWPIIATTYALVVKHPGKEDEVKGSLIFFDWVYQNGAQIVKSFNFLPVENKKTITSIEGQWKNITNAKGQVLWGEGVRRQ